MDTTVALDTEGKSQARIAYEIIMRDKPPRFTTPEIRDLLDKLGVSETKNLATVMIHFEKLGLIKRIGTEPGFGPQDRVVWAFDKAPAVQPTFYSARAMAHKQATKARREAAAKTRATTYVAPGLSLADKLRHLAVEAERRDIDLSTASTRALMAELSKRV